MKATEKAEQSMFAEQWDVYQSVIEHNYMFHAELIDIVKGEVNHFESPSVLDLGCGDSYVISESLSPGREMNYWGVDSAAMALESARSNLNHAKGEIALINEDFFAALKSLDRTFDVIISGYSLHHLQVEDKEECFSLVSNLISDNGVFILYDLERNSDETQPEYISRVCDLFANEWDQFDRETLEDIRTHVENNDIPENEAFYLENFKRVGFADVNKVFRDEDGAFAAYTARKIAR